MATSEQVHDKTVAEEYAERIDYFSRCYKNSELYNDVAR